MSSENAHFAGEVVCKLEGSSANGHHTQPNTVAREIVHLMLMVTKEMLTRAGLRS